jgi:hypothetical protein
MMMIQEIVMVEHPHVLWKQVGYALVGPQRLKIHALNVQLDFIKIVRQLLETVLQSVEMA